MNAAANTDDDIPRAEDAIPKNAISLTDAYDCVVSLVSNHPELLPKFDEEWSDALLRSRAEERKIGHDPETFDRELEEEWHRRKEANLFLRLAIEERELVACTRDPETGDILQLRSDHWIPSDWNDYIPPGIWTDYVIPDDYEASGPNGTLIRGALRPVFFMRDDFDAWFNKAFGKTGSTLANSESNPKILNLNRIRTHYQEAVREAVHAIWGQNGPPPGVTAAVRDFKINVWLKANGRVEVSEATIRRALRKVRSA
jgi:hypothetical protein